MPPRRVLCIDDYEPVLQSIKVLLQSAGYEVATAADAGAIEGLARTALAAAVIDYHLPDRNGQDIARTLKRLVPGLPIVMLSGYPEDVPEEALQWVDGFVAKGPNAAQELRSILVRLLDGPAAGEPARDKREELKSARARSLQVSDRLLRRFESES